MLERVTAAASLIVRHADAYGAIIAEDLGFAYAAFLQRRWAGVVFVVAGVFSIAMACVWAIALTWDTPGRRWLIAGLFVLTSVAALLVISIAGYSWSGKYLAYAAGSISPTLTS